MYMLSFAMRYFVATNRDKLLIPVTTWLYPRNILLSGRHPADMNTYHKI